MLQQFCHPESKNLVTTSKLKFEQVLSFLGVNLTTPNLFMPPIPFSFEIKSNLV